MTAKTRTNHLGEAVPSPTSFADPADFLLPGWDRAVKAVRSLHNLAPDWDGAGGRPVPADKLASTVRFCHLMRDAGQSPPSAVYPLAEGNVMLEWRFAGGVILRFEIESPGRGEWMATYPDGRKAQFWDYHWETDAPAFQWVVGCQPRGPVAKPRPTRGRVGGDSFSLAA